MRTQKFDQFRARSFLGVADRERERTALNLTAEGFDSVRSCLRTEFHSGVNFFGNNFRCSSTIRVASMLACSAVR